MTEQRRWFVGIDWARDSHHVRLLDELGHEPREDAALAFREVEAWCGHGAMS